MWSIIDEVAAQQLHNLDQSVRIVVAHPRYTQQHLLISHLLRQDDVVYVRFDGAELDYDRLNTQLQEVMSSTGNGSSLSGIQYLILDECDRALQADLTLFLNDMVGHVGSGRILLLTRSVPSFVFTNNPLREQSSFIPSESTLMFNDYSKPEDGQILLEVESLGGGRVTLNGKAIDNWDGTLPRALFFYLVDKGMSRRNQIFETFWPTLSARDATNVFHVTKRKISEVLGFDLTKYWSGFYHISPDIQLRYDVDIFSQLVTDSAVASPERADYLLSKAISLYRNHFLTSIPMEWTDKRGEELFSMYGDALAVLARLKDDQSLKDEALGLYLRASVSNPQREDITRRIMSLFAEKGMIEDAEATYQRLVAALDKYGIPPAKETQEMIERIRDHGASAGQ